MGGPSNSMQLRREAFTPARIISLARYSGLGSWFLFTSFMQRKGAQCHSPGGVGEFDGMLVRRRQCRCVCAVRSEGLFQREPSSRANSQSPVDEDVGGGLPLVVSQ